MLSKSKAKLIRSLEKKKARRELRLFVAEGPKTVGDILHVVRPRFVVATAEWLKAAAADIDGVEAIEVSEQELRQVSFVNTPQSVLAVFPIPEDDFTAADLPTVASSLSLALDGVQDPGNVGTIIRLADWFGIDHVFCSHDTADVYSPKVIQATMGSIARVRVHSVDLPGLLKALPDGTPVYGTLLDGENLYDGQLAPHGIIVMGNEGNGISDAVRPLVSRRLLIPSYPPGHPTADSLNVAIATAIVCAEFRRQQQ